MKEKIEKVRAKTLGEQIADLNNKICELKKENKQLKEQVAEQIDYKEEYYHYWQETKKELAIREKALELACDYVRDEWEGTGLEDKARKVGGFENYFIEQAKESLKNG